MSPGYPLPLLVDTQVIEGWEDGVPLGKPGMAHSMWKVHVEKKKKWQRGKSMDWQDTCHELSTTTDSELSSFSWWPHAHALSQAGLGLHYSRWAKKSSFLFLQGSWKLLELVRYHIVSNAEVSVDALLAQEHNSIFRSFSTLKAVVFKEWHPLSTPHSKASKEGSNAFAKGSHT